MSQLRKNILAVSSALKNLSDSAKINQLEVQIKVFYNLYYIF